MAGGKGARLGRLCKPLLKICGTPIIKRIIQEAYNVSDLIIASTPQCISTAIIGLNLGIEVIITQGNGYSLDLRYALRRVEPPVLVLPADLPLIDRRTIIKLIRILEERGKDIVTYSVPEGCLPGKLGPNGISLVREQEWTSDYETVEACLGWSVFDIDSWNDVFEVLMHC